MSVIVHLALREDWERAAGAGAYTPASLQDRGFIRCATAAQHAALANARFPDRADLVLLLVDADRLAAGVRYERSEPGGAVSPHVYGPLDLEAVFEATPYRPALDGRFHPYAEASAFAAHGATTLAEAKRRSQDVMAGFAGRHWVAGGWALDLFLDHRARPHADLELSVLAADQRALYEHLHGWDLRLAAPGASLPAWNGSSIPPPVHQLWARHGPGRPASHDEFAADPTMVEFLLEQSTGARWVFRRHPAITRPLEEVGAATTEGVAFVRPEIALLYKAKGSRFKDQRDFDRVLSHLDAAARTWLASALDQAHPGHVWREWL